MGNQCQLYYVKNMIEGEKQHNIAATIWVNKTFTISSVHSTVSVFFLTLPPKPIPFTFSQTLHHQLCICYTPILPFPLGLSVVRSVTAKAPLQRSPTVFTALFDGITAK